MLKRTNSSEKNARYSAVSCARKLRINLTFDVPVSSPRKVLMGFGALGVAGDGPVAGGD